MSPPSDPVRSGDPERDGARRAIALVAVAAGLLWLVWREHYFSTGWMDDDAFISFRYARNLVRGQGLVFNPGEQVEGYSNFLWTVLLALFHRLGADLPSAARVLGAACSLGGVALLALPAVRVLPPAAGGVASPPFPVAILAALLLCTSEPWAAWAVGGLENPFAACAILLAFSTYFRYLRDSSRKHLVASSVLCAAAALTHPSHALAGAVLGAHLLLRCARGRDRLAAVAWFAVPIAAVAAPYVGWKLAYYGHVLPNTFQAKFGITAAVLRRGLRYHGEAALAFPVLAAAVLGLAPLLALRRVGDPRPWILLAMLLAHCAYGLVIGGEDFAAFRLLTAVLPLACLLAQYAFAVALDAAKERRRAVLAVAVAVPLIAASGAAAGSSARVRVLDEAIANDAVHLFRESALELKRRFPEDTLFAHSGAGVMAFYTEFRFLDTLGLTDPHIARRRVETLGLGGAGHEKGDGRYVYSRRPHLVMFSGSPVSSLTPGLLGDRELLAMPEFRRDYSPFLVRFRFRPPRGPGRLVDMPVFVRNDVTIR